MRSIAALCKRHCGAVRAGAGGGGGGARCWHGGTNRYREEGQTKTHIPTEGGHSASSAPHKPPATVNSPHAQHQPLACTNIYCVWRVGARGGGRRGGATLRAGPCVQWSASQVTKSLPPATAEKSQARARRHHPFEPTSHPPGHSSMLAHTHRPPPTLHSVQLPRLCTGAWCGRVREGGSRGSQTKRVGGGVHTHNRETKKNGGLNPRDPSPHPAIGGEHGTCVPLRPPPRAPPR